MPDYEVSGQITDNKATIDLPSVADDDRFDDEIEVDIAWGDGTYDVAKTGETVEHEFRELYVRQYAGALEQHSALLNNLTTVTPRDGRISSIYVRYNGSGENEPKEDDGQQPAGPWHSMRTHDDVNGYVAENDITKPDGWDAMSLTEKRRWLDGNASV